MKRYTIIELGRDEEQIIRYDLKCDETITLVSVNKSDIVSHEQKREEIIILNSVTYRRAIDYIYEFMEPGDLLQEVCKTRNSMLLSYDDIQNSAGKKAFDAKRKR